jgi:hypothetical protein
MRWEGHVASMEQTRNADKFCIGKSDGKRSLRRPRYRWEDNIRMDLKEIGWKCMDWMYLAQDRNQWRAVVNTVMNL